MSEAQTDRIQIQPETESDKPKRTPPTERISADAESTTQTVRIVPGEKPTFDEPMNDKLFDQYTIYSKIGNGGMGIVYLARDRRLGRFVAIKRLNQQAQRNPSLRQRFLQEARAVATLSHVHIVHIYALGEDEDGPFIVMEYVAGPDNPAVQAQNIPGGLTQPNPPLTLDQMVARHGPLQTEEAIELILKIGRAVAYAHTVGVIHRDLKPSNILLDKSSEPKIVDFGLARLMHRDESKLTVPGEKLLSLGYGAPEQEQDASLSDERADVYGLGALLYFTLTGQNPRYFREQDVPVALREVVIKALATDRSSRWPSAAAFNEALHNVQNKTHIETPTVKTTWHCKWCDAINPLTTKYCAECGWDGSEHCPECGADTFFGIQYCGTCGADARAYETILQLIGKMREAMLQHRYERIISYAGRVHGFEPAGPSGRQYLAEIQRLRNEAERCITKREQLREQIPIEMRAENFERAKAFIRQLRELSEDAHLFEEEEKQIPSLTFKRDLAHARRAIRNREWNTATMMCDSLINFAAPDDPDIADIRRIIRRHTVRSDLFVFLSISFGMLILYLASFPFIARYFAKDPVPSPVLAAYRPAYEAYQLPGVNVALNQYASWILPDNRNLSDWYTTLPPAPPPDKPESVNLPDDLKKKQEEYARQLAEINTEHQEFEAAWPQEYLHQLEQLMEQCRTAGDFDGWEVVRSEFNRFHEEQRLQKGTASNSVSPDLDSLMHKFRQTLTDQKLNESRKLVTLNKKYVNDLQDLQKQFMQDGQMDMASLVNAEIRRVKSSSQQVEAEAVVTAANAAANIADSEFIGPTQVLVPTAIANQIEEMNVLRSRFEKEITDLEKVIAQKKNEWIDRYLTSLTEQMDAYQKAGDYSGWECVKDEINRVEAERSISHPDIPQNAPELGALILNFIRQREDIDIERYELIIKTTGKYIEQLQQLQKKLTVDRQMDAATAVNAELRRVKSRPDYVTAQSVLTPEGPPLPPNFPK